MGDVAPAVQSAVQMTGFCVPQLGFPPEWLRQSSALVLKNVDWVLTDHIPQGIAHRITKADW